MAQHDYNLLDQPGASFRADLNNVLNAIISANSGDTEPTTTSPYMWWADTTNDVLRLRNAADSGWLNILDLLTGKLLGFLEFLTAVSGTNTVVASAHPLITSYAEGQVYNFIAANTNTGAVTLNINSIGATNIYKSGSLQLEPDDIISGQIISVVYDGTNFQIASGSGGGGAKANGTIYENGQTISSNYTLSTSKNGISVGPITIDTGISVTVPTGQRWVII